MPAMASRVAFSKDISFRRPHIVAEDQFMIAQEQMSVGDRRVGPDAASRTRGACRRRFRCFWNLEAADFGPLFWIGFEQDKFALVAVQIQQAVGTDDRAAAFQGLAFGPALFAGLEILAYPAASLRMPVNAVSQQHHAAVIVLHRVLKLLGIQLFDLETGIQREAMAIGERL